MKLITEMLSDSWATQEWDDCAQTVASTHFWLVFSVTHQYPCRPLAQAQLMVTHFHLAGINGYWDEHQMSSISSPHFSFKEARFIPGHITHLIGHSLLASTSMEPNITIEIELYPTHILMAQGLPSLTKDISLFPPCRELKLGLPFLPNQVWGTELLRLQLACGRWAK